MLDASASACPVTRADRIRAEVDTWPPLSPERLAELGTILGLTVAPSAMAA